MSSSCQLSCGVVFGEEVVFWTALALSFMFPCSCTYIFRLKVTPQTWIYFLWESIEKYRVWCPRSLLCAALCPGACRSLSFDSLCRVWTKQAEKSPVVSINLTTCDGMAVKLLAHQTLWLFCFLSFFSSCFLWLISIHTHSSSGC